jgi:hypothetical protein
MFSYKYKQQDLIRLFVNPRVYNINFLTPYTDKAAM